MSNPFGRPAAALAGLTAWLSAGAAAAAIPPLQATATADHHAGKMIFAELVTPDVAAAETFYGGMFGWSFRDIPVRGVRYVAVSLGDTPIGGLIGKPIPPGSGRQPAWLPFLSTADVDATAAMAERYGATVLFAPRTVPDLGREAVLKDPQGSVFALMTSASGDPPDILPDAGGWLWTSLITADPTADVAFYRVLFGYQVYTTADAADRLHMVLASDNYARASVNPLPAARRDRPGWLDFIRVDDVPQAVAKAISLGGHVLVPAHSDREGDPVAIVADPAGAAFGLMQWSADAPEESAK